MPRSRNLKNLEIEMKGYLQRQIEWSRKTFGSGKRTLALINHIEAELKEIKANPYDLTEWIDIVILALDGFWRHGGSPETIVYALQTKQNINIARKWPESVSDDQPSFHEKTDEELEKAKKLTAQSNCNHQFFSICGIQSDTENYGILVVCVICDLHRELWSNKPAIDRGII